MSRKWFVNVAISFDARISKAGERISLSSEEDWQIVQQFRNKLAGIVVGSNTVIVDNPSLLTHEEYFSDDDQISHPVRIVLDRRGRSPKNSRVFADQNISPTIWVTESDVHIKGIKKIVASNIPEIVAKVNEYLEDLAKPGDVMIEGGAKVITSFINSGYVGQMRVFRSTKLLPKGVSLFSKPLKHNLVLIAAQKLSDGIEEIYRIE